MIKQHALPGALDGLTLILMDFRSTLNSHEGHVPLKTIKADAEGGVEENRYLCGIRPWFPKVFGGLASWRRYGRLWLLIYKCRLRGSICYDESRGLRSARLSEDVQAGRKRSRNKETGKSDGTREAADRRTRESEPSRRGIEAVRRLRFPAHAQSLCPFRTLRFFSADSEWRGKTFLFSSGHSAIESS